MFGLLGSKCPLDTGEKMWTEFRMKWLVDKLGIDRLLGAEMILPDPRYFPDPFSADPDDARRIFDRVCRYVKIDPARFKLEVHPDESMPEAVGLYQGGEQPRISLANSLLTDPERLVAAIAHELAHDILLGGGLITVDVEDHEYLTDLVPVFLGLGLFAANAPLRYQHYHARNSTYFQIHRQGYLPSHMLGYALALFAYIRGERKPTWARHLRLDAAQPLKAGLRYLTRTGDSLLRPDNAHQPCIPPTDAELIDRLAAPSPTVRMMALCDVANRNPPPAALLAHVICRLNDRDVDIRTEAARVIPIYSEAASAALPDLIRCVASEDAGLRYYAAAALTTIGGPDDLVVPQLTLLLQDPEAAIVDTAALGLGRHARAAASSVPALVEAIRLREIACHPSDVLADTLVAVDPPADVLERLLTPMESGVRKSVLRSLRTARYRIWERSHPPSAEAESS